MPVPTKFKTILKASCSSNQIKWGCWGLLLFLPYFFIFLVFKIHQLLYAPSPRSQRLCGHSVTIIMTLLHKIKDDRMEKYGSFFAFISK